MRRRKLTRNQRIAVVGLFVAALGSALTAAVVAWQTRVTRAVYSGPWLRFEYYICTGPYNNTIDTFQALPVAAAEDTGNQRQSPARRDFVIQNPVFKVIKLLEPDRTVGPKYSGGGTVAIAPLTEELLDSITGAPAAMGYRRQPFGSDTKRSPDEVDRKLRHYFDYFHVNRPTVRMMAAVGAVPPWVPSILKANPAYDELVDLAISQGPHGDAIDGVLYFRSMRTVHVRIENVSPYSLTRIVLRLKAFGPFDKPSLSTAITGSDRAEDALVTFPLSVLQPGEAVVYPLGVSLIPHLAASSLMVGASPVAERIDDLYDEKEGRVTFLSSGNQQELSIRPAYELNKVQFHVRDENELHEEMRAKASDNFLMVSKTCECGSCPLLFWQTKGRGWLRAREILTNASGPLNAEDFEIDIPASVDGLRLAENPVEVTSLARLEVVETLRDGRTRVHRIIGKSGARITDQEPLTIDLRAYRARGSSVVLKGRGFYVPNTSVVCPYVFPLPSWWAQ